MKDMVEEFASRHQTQPEAGFDGPPLQDRKIACIMDEFSYECFRYESQFIPLEPENWIETMLEEQPDLLMVESAWRGQGGKWQHKISSWRNSRKDIIYKLVEYCRKQNIPTVFWNKEDPSNFEFFIDSARFFDYIFTSDENSMARYQEITGHDRIFVLPFAAQPRLHNPINKQREKLGQVAFAGTWYNHKYAKRREYLQHLLMPARAYDLHIYNRMHNSHNRSYTFPVAYKPYIKGFLDYQTMIKTYKKYLVFLNVNSVEDSPTMCSRRIFEVLACGISVISTPSLAVQCLFPGLVEVAASESEAARSLEKLITDKEYRDKLGLLGYRNILQYHTYQHRLQHIFDCIGLPRQKVTDKAVAVLIPVRDKEDLSLAWSNFARQDYPYKELIIIYADKSDIPYGWLKYWSGIAQIRSMQELGDGSGGRKTLDGCFVSGINSPYLLWMEPHHYYAPNYLTDLVQADLYTEADIIGKAAYYEYDMGSQQLLLRNPEEEHCYTDSLSGAFLLTKKQAMEKPGLDLSLSLTDCGFSLRCQASGRKLYSADRFNFVRNAYVGPLAPRGSGLKKLLHLPGQPHPFKQILSEVSV